MNAQPSWRAGTWQTQKRVFLFLVLVLVLEPLLKIEDEDEDDYDSFSHFATSIAA